MFETEKAGWKVDLDVESLPAIEKEGMGSVEKRKETEYVKIVGDRYRVDTILENNSPSSHFIPLKVIIYLYNITSFLI